MKFSNQKYSECIANAVVQSKIAQSARNPDSSSSYPGYIPMPDIAVGANYCLVQAYVDPAELAAAGKTFDDIAGIPLVTINESDIDSASLDAMGNLNINSVPVAGYTTPGQKLLNWGNFLIETANNISKAMIIPFDENINVYVALTFYK